MSRLSEVLREIDGRLDLPQPARSRLLLEIAGDLEDLVRDFEGRGLSHEDALERALELCDLSDEAISQLVAVHAGGYRRFLERLSEQGRRWWERALLGLLFAGVLAGTGRLVLSARVFRDAGPLVWPVLALGAAGLLLVLPKLYAAWLRQDHDARRLRRGLAVVPALACANLSIGILGAWLGLYFVARRASLEEEPSTWFFASWLQASAALLVVCLLTVILLFCAWFLLASKLARIERAEAELLLLERP
jgi:hypothetical protein